jgi:hypothetical protein
MEIRAYRAAAAFTDFCPARGAVEPVSLDFMTGRFAHATECQRVDRRSPVRLALPSDSRPLSTLST